ncbi:pancreatic secretory granule membrane major glycoprotein GP2-like [Amblyraja radiata]|uniref:pancreatic secretory granule membrane major glycoprotein GP2-like n=1 Tax=Amblyraja radiata TaxID=386614 RepID=UPI001403AA9D|nr:pancreatic secretory granule membrane major glycoprotein GP2-like [Amblyraja radiata]
MPPGEVRLLLLILGSLATDSALGDPCVTHTVLDQPWRSTDCSNTECSGGTWMDDGNLAVGWYRFNSSGGWKIPETDVPVNHCSGKYPGWIAGRVRVYNTWSQLLSGRVRLTTQISPEGPSHGHGTQTP